MFDPVRIGRKKNEQITRMVTRMERLKCAFGISLGALAADAGISYGCLMRWRRRIGSGRPPLQAPGPKKTSPLDLQQLHQDIDRLQHGRKRSRQTTGLHRAHANSLSRRDIDALIRDARKRSNRKQAAACQHVIWHAPNLTWALDGSQFRSRVVAGKLHLQNLQDLCSRYKFPPLTTDYPPCGEEVSGYLAHQFGQFGAPLFCKRDNGGNLNHLAVNALFEEAFVIPINSPVATPPYNGAIEHAQGEMKGYLRRWQAKAGSMASLSLLAEAAAHDLNHQFRRVLGGRNACQLYFGKNALRYTKRKRKSVYRWIRDLAAEISIRMGKTKINATAWRIAAKTWLEKNNLITIVNAEEVLPYFPNNLCHH
jgi:hypothetical protein